MLKDIKLICPQYEFNDSLNLKEVAGYIDAELIRQFEGKDVVIRGIQSEKHSVSKADLIKHIAETGTDKYERDSENSANVSDKKIDLFGLACKVEESITLPTLEGFHRWKPKSLERPQRRVDIWMVYDATQLENVEYMHSHYNVLAKDGYVFKNPKKAKEALLGILVIN